MLAELFEVLTLLRSRIRPCAIPLLTFAITIIAMMVLRQSRASCQIS